MVTSGRAEIVSDTLAMPTFSPRQDACQISGTLPQLPGGV